MQVIMAPLGCSQGDGTCPVLQCPQPPVMVGSHSFQIEDFADDPQFCSLCAVPLVAEITLPEPHPSPVSVAQGGSQ